MVPYSSLNRIHGWINCEKHMKKKKSEKKNDKYLMSVQGK